MSHGGSFPLSDSIALIIIAGLLSLLPVMVLLWVYYVRERRPTVGGATMTRFFVLGMLGVGISVLFERGIYGLWTLFSPETARVFFAEDLFFSDLPSLSTAIAVSFGTIALIEEGVRYVLMSSLFRRTREFDQQIDSVQYGFALGLGFAFVENTLYFLQLFRGLDFDTLAIVFFLRFLISTVGHLSFGGIMGYAFGMAEVFPADRRLYLRRAFWIPWMMHGIFDTLLSVQLSFYTVLLLSIPLFIFWRWFQDDAMFQLHTLRGHRLKYPISSKKVAITPPRPQGVEVLPAMHLCPNCTASLSEKAQRCTSCGLRLHRRGLPTFLPFPVEEQGGEQHT